MFGVWKTTNADHLDDGSYQIESCDATTRELIQYSLKTGENLTDEDFDEKVYRNGSQDNLVMDDELLKEKTLFKHEIDLTEDRNGELTERKLTAVYKDTYELINAKETKFENKDGKLVYKLKQNRTKMLLLPLDPLECKIYAADQLIRIENSIEEPFDFFPWGAVMSLQKYCFIASNFFQMLKRRRNSTKKRTDVYKYMFLCDFINFFVLLFGFSEFSVSFLTFGF